MTLELRRAAVPDMDPLTLYRVLELRIAVFVVEQAAAYPDVDSRDAEPGAELLWAEEDGAVLATARILVEPAALRIGRVATAAAARGRGAASAIMRAALERCADRDPAAPVLLDAQEHLVPWYERFGFAVAAERHYEDGIPHREMRRARIAP